MSAMAGQGTHDRNAASVAGLLFTTEVMIADAPKDESEHARMPPGGAIDDMGM